MSDSSPQHPAPAHSPDAVFAPAYDRWMRERLAGTPPRDRDGFISPSQALGCATAAVHQLNGAPRETRHPPDLEDLFRIATQVHEYYQAHGRDMGILTDCERVVELPQWRVRGQIDGILTLPPREPGAQPTRALLEIKTLPEWLFEQVAAERKPLQGHLAQTMLYLRATGLTRTHFLYVERSYFRKLELVQAYDPAVMARVEEWMRGVLEHHERGTYPDAADVWQPDGRCRTCVYFATCRDRVYR